MVISREIPFRDLAPRDSVSNLPARRSRVTSLMTIEPAGASVCRREAMWGVSPTIASGSRVTPAPISPATTVPLLSPIRTCRVTP